MHGKANTNVKALLISALPCLPKFCMTLHANVPQNMPFKTWHLEPEQGSRFWAYLSERVQIDRRSSTERVQQVSKKDSRVVKMFCKSFVDQVLQLAALLDRRHDCNLD